jgi:hypothetical protein
MTRAGLDDYYLWLGAPSGVQQLISAPRGFQRACTGQDGLSLVIVPSRGSNQPHQKIDFGIRGLFGNKIRIGQMHSRG